jgi:hemerythrin-like domain-containing protein
MGQITKAMCAHHKELLETVSERVSAITDDRPEADPKGLAHFLRDEVLHHAEGEEQHLYPALDPLVIAYGRPTAGMHVDHEYIEGYIDWIQETVEELETADPEEHPRLQALLRKLCLQLEAVLQLHMSKEERIYLPLFEQYLSEAEQQRIVDRMNNTEKQELDEDRAPFYAHKIAAVVRG